ncbi:tRNA (cytosine(32)/uridine(32)-2'-O)-methyltransferase TrmJ [Motiliproteus sp. MSK22-1]|uniref:tRNA (cytosine(32)/uridine(32)-2'-O)-methyltransferase TrmJ n=1 Tax=Motiliproteus sp. MSK22-1 TaxID=1897630 RepID=UPI0009781E65|nr:tRNA (cytosine(32)/uridine(32)-2'-O)-methyltransferase TrmJ [Motiliproteus sp. MSK22-1]OMH32834.1 tRNA (cytosine(32)/uridine(32)-2'-O)-methyltransferase TrmJ [Motiliproteus sp. MSK22-1]
MLNNIRVVMINTFHPGNIGAAARALKNMGLSQLYLVDPKEFPHPEAESRAAGALDLLNNAVVVKTLEEAIKDCSLVVGTSARNRSFPWPMLDARNCAEKAVIEAKSAPVAIVFGRERMGLHNEELMQCNFHLAIPTDPVYPVLNVSAAIQVVCYELWLAQQNSSTPSSTSSTSSTNNDPLLEYPSSEEMGHFYTHLENTLKDINFIVAQHEGKVMTKLRRLFNRARPEKVELNMLRGVLSAIQRNTKK